MANKKSIGYTISIINRYSNIYFSEALSDLNIHGSGQLRIVLNLSKNRKGITQDKLANELLVDKGSISRMIRPLIKSGLIERKKNPEDQRAYIIKLTKKTETKLPEIIKRTKKWTKILSQDLSKDELTNLFSLLEKVEKNTINYTSNTHPSTYNDK